MKIESELNLDPKKIVDTVGRLEERIGERFPDSGLRGVCWQLHEISKHMIERAEWIGRPVMKLRVVTWGICVLILLVTILPFYYLLGSDETLNLGAPEGGVAGFIQLMESAINDVVLIGAAIFFFLTIETRYKRERALKAMHELRTIAHIIDMHQLTKDPHRILRKRIYQSTDLSPKLELTPFLLRRYLDYCSEMLALTGKIAAVYVQEFDDPVAMASASELETLTAGLSSKIWQKISILDTTSESDPPIQKINSI